MVAVLQLTWAGTLRCTCHLHLIAICFTLWGICPAVYPANRVFHHLIAIADSCIIQLKLWLARPYTTRKQTEDTNHYNQSFWPSRASLKPCIGLEKAKCLTRQLSRVPGFTRAAQPYSSLNAGISLSDTHTRAGTSLVASNFHLSTFPRTKHGIRLPIHTTHRIKLSLLIILTSTNPCQPHT